MHREAIFQNKRISYSVRGSGKDMVLLHGYMLSSTIWGKFAELLSSRFRLITIDLPGHGRSDFFPPVHSMELMADAVAAVLQKEAKAPVRLLGHSMGGYVALAFLEKYASLLSSLILLNSYPFADSANKAEVRKRMITLIRNGRKELIVRMILKDLFPPETKGIQTDLRESTRTAALQQTEESLIATTMGMLERRDKSHLLRNSDLPILWITGTEDLQNDALELLKEARERNIPPPRQIKMGHMSFLEDPEALHEVLKNL